VCTVNGALFGDKSFFRAKVPSAKRPSKNKYAPGEGNCLQPPAVGQSALARQESSRGLGLVALQDLLPAVGGSWSPTPSTSLRAGSRDKNPPRRIARAGRPSKVGRSRVGHPAGRHREGGLGGRCWVEHLEEKKRAARLSEGRPELEQALSLWLVPHRHLRLVVIRILDGDLPAVNVSRGQAAD
jgi:hypothetical protein